MELLPTEMIRKIFDNLYYFELLNYLSISSYYQDIIKDILSKRNIYKGSGRDYNGLDIILKEDVSKYEYFIVGRSYLLKNENFFKKFMVIKYLEIFYFEGEIPSDLFKLKLKSLTLSGIFTNTIEIFSMITLESLSLSCELQIVPQEIGNLINLKFLSLKNNKLKNIDNLTVIPNLESINLIDNLLISLPIFQDSVKLIYCDWNVLMNLKLRGYPQLDKIKILEYDIREPTLYYHQKLKPIHLIDFNRTYQEQDHEEFD